MSGTQVTDELSSDLIAEAISWRRHLHQHPELAFNEWQTADFIASELGRFGLTVHRGLAGTGVVGTLTRGTSKRAVGIRADMDALAIQEQSAVRHASRSSGIMHACGHDGHVAIALAAACACAGMPDLDGTVHFIFQPAEEAEGGARRMIEEGLFRLFPCEAVYALHNWPTLPLGTCVVRDAAMMAAMGIFEIVIAGHGCHGAMPHEGSDSILAGCQLVSALQSIVSRNVDPLEASVVSVTQIRAGDSFNVIPDTCVVLGTTRWFDDSVGERLEHRVMELSRSIAAAFGCKAQVRYERRFPASINDPSAARFVRAIVNRSRNLAMVDARPSMGAEDFAFMLQAVPGCYVWLGSATSGSNPGLHSSRYDFNDGLLPLGATLWISVIRQSLASS